MSTLAEPEAPPLTGVPPLSEVGSQNGSDHSHQDPKGDEEPAKPLPPGQIPIPGTQPKLTLNAGGRMPDSAEVSIQSAKRPVDGQLQKGEKVKLVVIGIVSDVQFPDSHDENGEPTGTARRHIVRPISVTIAD